MGNYGKTMNTARPLCLLALAWMGLAASAHAQSANPYATPSAAAAAQGSAMDDLTSFATGGAKVLESIKGDLTGERSADVLLVLDPPLTGKETLGQGAWRDVVLLTRDANGTLHKAASNPRLVPCAQCGGMAGDPYAYSRISKGQFTIVIGGGSRERWTDEYNFTYVGAKKDWFVSTVVRRVADSITGKQKHIELATRELGTVTFAAFDPGQLPEVTLP